jgi:predicted Zn-dependent protease
MLRGFSWKRIEVGVTARDEVERRFKAVRSDGAVAQYPIDRMQITIGYGADGKVASIRLPPAIAISSAELSERFGVPDRIRQLRDGGTALDYQRAGLSVEYTTIQTAPAAVEVVMPTARPDETQRRILAELVPTRPPLNDLPRRINAVQEALSERPKGFSWVSASSEMKQATAMYAELQSKDLLMGMPELQDYASGLTARLASVIPATPVDWKLIFIRGVLPNAMNAGGGYIFPTQGLLEQFDTESELAFVIAHEMAHQLKGHVAASETRQQMASTLITMAEIATEAPTGLSGVTGQAGSLVAQTALAHYDRAQETEADRVALDIVAAAGYDPRLALSAMERAKAVEEKYRNGPTIAASHPNVEAREEGIQNWLNEHNSQDYSRTLVTTQEFIEIRSRYRLNPW